jgi:putative ABC transport system permease protein
LSTAIHLTFKEIWRNRTRYLLFSLVVALITVLILFVAALGEGLGSGNREYLEKLNGELVVYQDTARLSIPASRLECTSRNVLRGVEGVREAGSVGFSTVSVPSGDLSMMMDMMVPEYMDVSFIGVEPGMPGEPPVLEGTGLQRKSADEAVIDRSVALMGGLEVGDEFMVRSAQGNEDQYYELRVVGIADSRKYAIRPSVFVPILVWDKMRPQPAVGGGTGAPVCNVAVVQLEDPAQIELMGALLESRVSGIEAVDRVTAYENTPGYSEQQSTLATQNGFALLIGMLVIGGFFQIQILQKVSQIGMLKAIGTPNAVVGLATVLQIVVITLVGIVIGSAITLGLSLTFPPTIPLVFDLRTGLTTILTILAVGPIGGLVAIRYSLRIEPLTALGLDS